MKKHDPLQLPGTLGEDGQPAFLVDNDETREPEVWSATEVEQNRRFKEFLANAPRPVVTKAVLILNIQVFVVMAAFGAYAGRPADDSFLRWGADYGPLTIDGQWWRVVMAMFLHFNLMHLLMNMAGLLYMGWFAERLFGRARFGILYLLAGVGGNLNSLYWHPLAVAGGASGAIFGVFGGVLGFVLFQPGIVPKHRVRSLAKGAAVFIGANLLYSFTSKEIDAAAHVGGLVTGFVLAAAFTRAMVQKDFGVRLRMCIVDVMVVLAIFTAMAFRLPALNDYQAEMTRMMKLDRANIKLYAEAVANLKSGQITRIAFGEVIPRQILAPWNAERERVLRLRIPNERRANAGKMAQYMLLRAQGWGVMERGILYNNPLVAAGADAKFQEAQAILTEISPGDGAPKK